MNFKDIISIAAVIATTVVAVVSIFLNHRSNLKHQLFLEKLRIYKELMVIVSQSTSQRANREELHLRIREALQKARFSCMETYLFCSSTGEKVDDRKNAVGFRLWIRCHRLWHWNCYQSRPQFSPLDTKRQTWQWNR